MFVNVVDYCKQMISQVAKQRRFAKLDAEGGQLQSCKELQTFTVIICRYVISSICVVYKLFVLQGKYHAYMRIMYGYLSHCSSTR